MKALSVFKTGENNNFMWLVIIVDLMLFALAFTYGIELNYCYLFLLIPICINLMISPFNLATLFIGIVTLFGFLYGLDLKIEDCVFFSIMISCGLSLISYFRMNCKKKFKLKSVRTGRYR